MHQVLYRMYRPKNFDEIYGQDHIIPILKNQITTNNIGHAYLFTGPRGTGKTSTARIFATELNGGSEMDIIELDAASHNKVEDIREIIDRLSLAPFEGKYKIYILDEVHMLSAAAANAFLKSLEEPPDHVIFILATTEPNKLPATILSRTQRFDFNKITLEVIVKRLKVVLNEEGVVFTDDALDFIARKSDGGLRDALSLLDKAISYGELTIENVTKALGSIQSKHQIDILHAIAHNDTLKTLLSLEEVRREGLDPKVFLFDLIEYLRDVILLKNGISIPNTHAQEVAEFINDKMAAYLLEELSKTLGQLRFSANPDAQMMAEIVLLANTNFEQLELYRQLPSIVKTQLNEQALEINQLRQKIASLEHKLANFATYPQNFVDNNNPNVNKMVNPADSKVDFGDNLSTENLLDIATSSQIKTFDISDEERKRLTEYEALSEQLKQKLKDIKRYNIYSVLMMATPKRFVGENLFFVFEGENKGMLKMMQSTEPNKFIDPILSELLQQRVVTHYVTDEELSQIPEDKWQSFINEIKQVFPESELEIIE